MKSTIHAKRKIDAIIALRQDNVSRKLLIINMNNAAEKLIGRPSQEMVGKNISTILPPRINEILLNYIEFGNASNDFASVARRIPNFQVVNKKGEVVPISLKVFNLVPSNSTVLEYELLIRDITLISKIAELKNIILQNGDKILDKDTETNLPSINAVVYAIDTSYNFLKQYNSIEVCFALIRLNNMPYFIENFGNNNTGTFIGKLGSEIKKCCRGEDVVGYMGEGVIGVVLIDCNIENAKSVIGRIETSAYKANIPMPDGQLITPALGIAYTQIKNGREMQAMINDCEIGLNKILQNGGIGLAQV